MSEGLNLVTLFGNLGADAELRQTASGPVCKFRLATTVSYLDKERNKKEETEWHRVTMFGRRGETLAPLLKKGDRIFVKGRLHTSSYEKEGQKHYSTEVIATDILFGGGGGRPNGTYARPPAQEATISAAEAPF